MSTSSAPPPPEVTTEPTESDKEIARLRERVKELEARLAPPDTVTTLSNEPQFSSIVLFGADGNLATKKTFPTLFALWRKKLLPRDIVIVGYAREVMNTEEFRKNIVYKAIYSSAHAQRERRRFLQRVHYCSGQFDDAKHVRERLAPLLAKLEQKQILGDCASDDEPLQHRGSVQSRMVFASSDDSDEDVPVPVIPRQDRRRVRVYYMAVPPFLYSRICRSLAQGGLRSETGRDRFVLEKPFGKCAQSCASLCRELASLLREDEAYRIDHYLGKELVMNVLVLRFGNAIFEAVWSRRFVERVEICCLEEVDCKGRGGYFDAYGIIRDVTQNHLAQLLALVAMEQPLSLKADDVRREKVRALRACKVLDSRDVVRGQYDGYADDSSITNKKTTTETFAACKLFVDTPRWAGVPFILTAGKALQEKKVEVRIVFREAPCQVPELRGACRNELVVRVQPDERVYWRVANKVPGLEELQVEPRRMNLMYTHTEVKDMPDAYERLVLEVLRGDATNFVSVEELDASWAVFSPALLALEGTKPERYAYGSTGPSLERLYGSPKKDRVVSMGGSDR
ncbi:unnamed protein product [Pelagomonas calceolata]|uniref:glucose-6-phosphate dehydrogenase (NADP(+)) n=1 Tax=Pelagomonas calceolata TaxID=35677 RepID=A0A7S4ED86_9STRA|nr:unnamed protein product [Pelagomonas calceolata]|mmetsp:Transcript_26482/g.80338  ORF Transcript_26482/g.80338 Transcript_26482/m.80338 type:complete len:569 (+) Transcript_26482:162-1868(+)